MRCKNCKEKFEPVVFNQKYCFKDDCVRAFNLETWNKVTKPKKIKQYGLNKKTDKQVLQDEINKLARLIDECFNYPCISCGTTNKVQYAGGHRVSVGACTSIRYNLHNIRKQCNKNCNKEKSGNPDGYDQGLINRYDLDYKNFVKYELRKIYSYVDLGSVNYTEKIRIVRKLIRTFNKEDYKDDLDARDSLNEIIGIYTKGTNKRV